MSSPHKAVVETYFEGFRRSDHDVILSCLTDDVVWDLPGFKQVSGKSAFDLEIENEEFTGSPVLEVDRLIEEASAVVASGPVPPHTRVATSCASRSATCSRSLVTTGCRGSSPTWCRSASDVSGSVCPVEL